MLSFMALTHMTRRAAIFWIPVKENRACLF